MAGSERLRGMHQIGMRFTFQTEQWVPYPVELVFAFFANPENLPRLMPGWQKARLEEATFRPPPPAPNGRRRTPGIAAGDGTRLTLSFRPLPLSPVRLSWEAEIQDFRWNEGFADIQLSGPFRYWRQQHRVAAAQRAETLERGTTITDHIEYELPLQDALAPLANKAVEPQIAMIFRHRHKRTEELLARMAGA